MTNLEMAFYKESLFWKENSRVNWLLEGDRNTIFFHSMVKIKQATNFIFALKIEGFLITGPRSVWRTCG